MQIASKSLRMRMRTGMLKIRENESGNKGIGELLHLGKCSKYELCPGSEMDNTVTVKEALKKGRMMITYPSVAILFVLTGLSLYFGANEILTWWMALCGAGAGFILAWLYWSVMITKWRLWAFANVDNVHELKRRAIKENLLWKDNSLFGKTEIRSAAEQEHINALERKLRKPEIFKDDYALPPETIIYYSVFKNTLRLLSGLACLAGGIYLLITSDGYLIPFCMIGISACICFMELRQVIDRKPQITLNKNGLQTVSTPLYKWSEISNEQIYRTYGERIHLYLKYDHPAGTEELRIDEYAITQSELEHLMHIYRGRNK
jgi:hypothetical protein